MQIVERNRSGCWRLHGREQPRDHGVRIVRCKGEKWRVDVCVTEDLGSATAISSAGDLEKLWRNRPKNAEMSGVLLAMGGSFPPEHRQYRRPRRPGWKAERQAGVDGGRGVGACVGDWARALIELVAFPPGLCSQLTSVPVHTVSFDPRGENGPAGSVRLDVRFDKPRAAGVSDWGTPPPTILAQPKYGYAVVRDMCPDEPDGEEGRRHGRVSVERLREYGDYSDHPRGVWYPTKVCRKNAGHGAGPRQPGRRENV